MRATATIFDKNEKLINKQNTIQHSHDNHRSRIIIYIKNSDIGEK